MQIASLVLLLFLLYKKQNISSFFQQSDQIFQKSNSKCVVNEKREKCQIRERAHTHKHIHKLNRAQHSLSSQIIIRLGAETTGKKSKT